MGKKPLNGVAKVAVLLVRVTSDERSELDTAAAESGKATSTWLRDLGLMAARAAATVKSPAKKRKKPPTSSPD